MDKTKSETKPEMTVGEILDAFPDEWVLIDVTDTNDQDWTATRGLVLFHHRQREKVEEARKAEFEKVTSVPRRAVHFYLLEPMPPMRNLQDVTALIERWLTEGPPPGWKPGRWF